MLTVKTTMSNQDLNKVFDRIKSKLDKVGFRAINVTQKKVREDIQNIVVPVISKGFADSRVIKALTGKNVGRTDGSDLLAEFGLDTSTSQRFLDALASKVDKGNYIKFSPLKLSSVSGKAKAEIEFKYFDDTFVTSLIYLPGARYTSNGHLIPWVYWSIRQDTDVDGWEIEYELTADEARRSRSGNAVMKTGGFYEIPDIVKSSRNNWVEEIFIRNRKEIEKSIRVLVGKTIRPSFRQAFRQTI